MPEKPIPTRPPDPDRQEGHAVLVEPCKRADAMPRPDSLLARGKLRPPRGRFRLIGCDTFDHWSADFHVADYDNLDDAITEAKARVAKYGSLMVYHVYSHTGEAVFSTR